MEEKREEMEEMRKNETKVELRRVFDIHFSTKPNHHHSRCRARMLMTSLKCLIDI